MVPDSPTIQGFDGECGFSKFPLHARSQTLPRTQPAQGWDLLLRLVTRGRARAPPSDRIAPAQTLLGNLLENCHGAMENSVDPQLITR